LIRAGIIITIGAASMVAEGRGMAANIIGLHCSWEEEVMVSCLSTKCCHPETCLTSLLTEDRIGLRSPQLREVTGAGRLAGLMAGAPAKPLNHNSFL